MAADSVNLQKSQSALNEKLVTLFDESGVKRSFTVPYIDGQGMDEHISAVGQAAMQVGGLTNNLVVTAHHSTGKGWGTGDGHTVGHSSEKLRSTIIPKDDEKAKAVIAAAQKHLSNIGSLIGDEDPAVKMANSQLALVKKGDGAGMNLLDFGIMMTQLCSGPNQAIARAHQGASPEGHSAKMSPGGAQPPQEAQAAPAGEAQPPDSTQQAPAAPEAAPQEQGQ